MRARVHLVLLWNAIWSPEHQPALGRHLCHSLSRRYGTGASPVLHIHPSASSPPLRWEKCPKRPVPPTIRPSYIKPSDDVILDVWSILPFLCVVPVLKAKRWDEKRVDMRWSHQHKQTNECLHFRHLWVGLQLQLIMSVRLFSRPANQGVTKQQWCVRVCSHVYQREGERVLKRERERLFKHEVSVYVDEIASCCACD